MLEQPRRATCLGFWTSSRSQTSKLTSGLRSKPRLEQMLARNLKPNGALRRCFSTAGKGALGALIAGPLAEGAADRPAPARWSHSHLKLVLPPACAQRRS